MKILVISGLLGAGKTTFIRELARRSGRDFAVYENEIGQVDIDASLIRDESGLSVWESAENCICCTGKQDFATSVLTIANTLDPEFLVVEPTGIARLSSIEENLAQIGYERIGLLPSIAIVDASAFSRSRSAFPDIFLDQIRSASTIICSKTDLALPEEVAALVSELSVQNPHARIVDQPYHTENDAWFAALLDGDFGNRPQGTRDLLGADGRPSSTDGRGADADEHPEQLSLSGLEFDNPVQLIALLDGLGMGTYGDVVRAKGIVHCGHRLTQWLKFDYADQMWAITGAEEPDRSQAVFIGFDLQRTALREAIGILPCDGSVGSIEVHAIDAAANHICC